jgi:translation initiation factor 6 (eIF-6)
MKMKEKSLYELNNNRILLESRCQQLEARNFELEQTVKLLKRRIQANDDLTITNDPMPHVPDTQTHELNIYGKMKQQLTAELPKCI